MVQHFRDIIHQTIDRCNGIRDGVIFKGFIRKNGVGYVWETWEIVLTEIAVEPGV